MVQVQQRPAGAVGIPAPGVWEIDPAHTSVDFVARHLMVAKVRGRFRSFSGNVTVGESPDDSRVDVTIDAGSIDTGTGDRDAHLRSPDFLDVERFPEIRFRSTRVERTGETALRLTGDLTIRDITKPVELAVEYSGLAQGPRGSTSAFSATAEIDREAFGMVWNQVIEAGGVAVGKTVTIEIDVELVQAAAQAA